MITYLFFNRPPQEAYPHSAFGVTNICNAEKLYTLPDGTQMGGYGTANYQKFLTLETCYKYDILPLHEKEYAEYIFYMYASRQRDDMAYFIEDYTTAYRNGNLKPTDPLYWASKILSEEE